MIELAFKIAYSSLLGISMITYLGIINFILVITALIMGLAMNNGKVNPLTYEIVAYFAIVITLINGILGLLLLF
mgnify:CR=1 FL=1